MDLHALAFQVVHHGQDEGFELVVPGEAQCAEVGEPADVVDETLDVALHLERAVPALEGEHGAPVQPEVGIEHIVGKIVGYGLVVELLFGGEEQVHDLHARLVGQVECIVEAGVFTPVDRCAAQGIIGIALVQLIVVIEDAHVLVLDGGDGSEQVPHHFEVVVHLATAAHSEAELGILPPVAGAARFGVAFEQVHARAVHLSIPDQVARGRQARQPGADDVGRFVLDALRLCRAGECFVVSAGIVHRLSNLST